MTALPIASTASSGDIVPWRPRPLAVVDNSAIVTSTDVKIPADTWLWETHRLWLAVGASVVSVLDFAALGYALAHGATAGEAALCMVLLVIVIALAVATWRRVASIPTR